jgi:hypothetical protein
MIKRGKSSWVHRCFIGLERKDPAIDLPRHIQLRNLRHSQDFDLLELVNLVKTHCRLKLIIDYSQINAFLERIQCRSTSIANLIQVLTTANSIKFSPNSGDADQGFLKCDGKSMFHQFSIAEEYQPFFAFDVPNMGIMIPSVVLYGIADVPSLSDFVSQKLVDSIKSKHPNLPVVGYVDDFGVRCSLPESRTVLRSILQYCQENSIFLSLSKLFLFHKNIDFLGHNIDHVNGILPTAKTLAKIIQIQRPHNKKELQSLLALLNWIRPHLHADEQLALLTDLLKKTAVVSRDWSHLHDQALEVIKQSISCIPLKPFVPGKICYLLTDASPWDYLCPIQ